MKIKKKEYKRKLKDEYWRGVEVGINFAKARPDIVNDLEFGELIDFLNRKISADDVIEEFNRVTRLEVLKIIDKYTREGD